MKSPHNSKLVQYTTMFDKLNFVPESINKMMENHRKLMQILPKIKIPDLSPFTNQLSEITKKISRIEGISKIGERIINNPEIQFGFISDLEILNLSSANEFKQSLINDITDENFEDQEELINRNLIPYLERLGVESLWLGANFALKNKDNPDRLRHCLTSLRTLLEYLIDDKLAPQSELKDSEMFKKEFRKYHLGRQELRYIRIKRAQKIEYFTSKIEFGMLDFTKKEIKYVCDCYSVLCNIHQPDIAFTENQVRSLKVKTGITLWLLAHIYEIIKYRRKSLNN